MAKAKEEPIQNFNKELFFKRLEQLYTANNATPEQLSIFIGGTVRRIENIGTPVLTPTDKSKIDAIAEFFEIHPDYLLGITEQPCFKANRAQPVDTKLPDRLFDLREFVNYLKPDEVAYFLRISELTYLSFERGEQEPMLTTLINLADYYNVSLDYLVGRTNNPRRL